MTLTIPRLGLGTLGNYRLAYPTELIGLCLGGKTTFHNVDIENEPTKKRLIAYDVPETANNDKNAHYAIGNTILGMLQWQVQVRFSLRGEAEGSICPKGWRLPMSNTKAATGDFQELMNAYSIKWQWI